MNFIIILHAFVYYSKNKALTFKMAQISMTTKIQF